MELLVFDRKRYWLTEERRIEAKADVQQVVARRDGGTFVVDDMEQRQMLHYANFGHQFGERQDNINIEIFRDKDAEPMQVDVNPRQSLMSLVTEEGRRWKALKSQIQQLYLSPEEVAYLYAEVGLLTVVENGKILSKEELWNCLLSATLHFVDRYAVYRKLREHGWVARSGLPYGCDYLIYHKGPQYYHATAGVRIIPNGVINPVQLLAYNRELFNHKKCLMMAIVTKPENSPINGFDDVRRAQIRLTVTKSWLIDRKMKAVLDDLISKIGDTEA